MGLRTVRGEWVGALAVVIAAAIAYLGVRYSARQSREASESAKVMENKAVDAAAYERARQSYEASIANYQREQERLETRLSQVNQRVQELNGEVLRVEQEKRVSDQDRRNMAYDLSATIEQLTEQRDETERHLKFCAERLQRLRSRLEDAGVQISEDDPDLQLDF